MPRLKEEATTNETLKARWMASEAAGKTPRQLQAMERGKYRRAFSEERAKAIAGRPMSKARASELLLRYHDSYSRLPEIMRFASIMNRRSWLAVLGEYWSVSDNLYEWDKNLEIYLRAAPIDRHDVCRRLLPGRTTLLMMDKDERAAWQAPPGCAPLLLTGEVAKGRITAVNLGRKEQEIITLHARVTQVEEL